MTIKISATQVSMFCRCPQQYYRRYICDEVIPPGIAMMQGSAVHAAANANFSQKISSKKDLPTTQIVDIAVDSFVKQTEQYDVKYNGADKDAVVAFARGHATIQAPDYLPTTAEHEVVVPVEEMPEPCSLVAIFDLVADNRVIDLKTTSRHYQDDAAAKSIQLATYAYAYKAAYKRKPDALLLDVLVLGKQGVSRQKLATSADPDFVTRMFLRRASALISAIKAGSFPPCDPTSWVCDPKWCGYYNTCPYVK